MLIGGSDVLYNSRIVKTIIIKVSIKYNKMTDLEKFKQALPDLHMLRVEHGLGKVIQSVLDKHELGHLSDAEFERYLCHFRPERHQLSRQWLQKYLEKASSH